MVQMNIIVLEILLQWLAVHLDYIICSDGVDEHYTIQFKELIHDVIHYIYNIIYIICNAM